MNNEQLTIRFLFKQELDKEPKWLYISGYKIYEDIYSGKNIPEFEVAKTKDLAILIDSLEVSKILYQELQKDKRVMNVQILRVKSLTSSHSSQKFIPNTELHIFEDNELESHKDYETTISFTHNKLDTLEKDQSLEEKTANHFLAQLKNNNNDNVNLFAKQNNEKPTLGDTMEISASEIAKLNITPNHNFKPAPSSSVIASQTFAPKSQQVISSKFGNKPTNQFAPKPKVVYDKALQNQIIKLKKKIYQLITINKLTKDSKNKSTIAGLASRNNEIRELQLKVKTLEANAKIKTREITSEEKLKIKKLLISEITKTKKALAPSVSSNRNESVNPFLAKRIIGKKKETEETTTQRMINLEKKNELLKAPLLPSKNKQVDLKNEEMKRKIVLEKIYSNVNSKNQSASIQPKQKQEAKLVSKVFKPDTNNKPVVKTQKKVSPEDLEKLKQAQRQTSKSRQEALKYRAELEKALAKKLSKK